MAAIYKPTGASRCKTTAVAVTQGPRTTQQIAVDQRDVLTMRAVTGACRNKGQSQPI